MAISDYKICFETCGNSFSIKEIVTYYCIPFSILFKKHYLDNVEMCSVLFAQCLIINEHSVKKDYPIIEGYRIIYRHRHEFEHKLIDILLNMIAGNKPAIDDISRLEDIFFAMADNPNIISYFSRQDKPAKYFENIVRNVVNKMEGDDVFKTEKLFLWIVEEIEKLKPSTFNAIQNKIYGNVSRRLRGQIK